MMRLAALLGALAIAQPARGQAPSGGHAQDARAVPGAAQSAARCRRVVRDKELRTGALGDHGAAFERGQHALGGHRLQRLAARGAVHAYSWHDAQFCRYSAAPSWAEAVARLNARHTAPSQAMRVRCAPSCNTLAWSEDYPQAFAPTTQPMSGHRVAATTPRCRSATPGRIATAKQLPRSRPVSTACRESTRTPTT